MGKRLRRRRCWAATAPTTVWLTGQRDPITDIIERGYHIDTAAYPGWVPPAVAEYAVQAYSPPGGTVLDPDCGAGSVVVEALRAGRSAIGLASTRQWRNLTRANVNAVRASGDVAFDAMVLVLARHPHTLHAAKAAGFAGQIDLILTALRASAGADTVRLRELLVAARPLLRAGGHLVVSVDPSMWRGGHPGQIVAAGIAGGLTPVERCVAVTGRLAGDKVVDRAPRSERRAASRRARATGHPAMVAAHLDVVVFQSNTTVTARRPIRLHASRPVAQPQPANARLAGVRAA